MSMMQSYSGANLLLPIAAAALIDQENRILVQLRPEGKPMAGLWEFPGGKVEDGELPGAALVRELHEELGLEVEEKNLVPLTFACEPTGNRQLLLLLYICRLWVGVPRPLVASALRWCTVDELQHLAMPPADLPLVERLRVFL